MRSKLLFLMLVFAAGLLCLPAAVRANSMIYNPSFEIDVCSTPIIYPGGATANEGAGAPDGWFVWGTNLSYGGDTEQNFVTGDPDGAHTGDNYFRAYCGGPALQSFAIPWVACNGFEGGRARILLEPQDTYFLGIWARDLIPGGSATPPIFECGYYNETGDRLQPDSVGKFYIVFDSIPADGQWHYVEGRSAVCPDPGYPYLNCVPMTNTSTTLFPGATGPSEYAFDDVWMNSNPQEGLVYGFDPYDGEESVTPSTTKLSWVREPKCPGRNLKVEVWWGKQDDPNFWYIPGEAIKIMELADANEVDLSTIPAPLGGPITLESDKVYYWKVMSEEPNACLWGAPLNEGPTLSFDTINRAPVVDAGLNVDTWQDDPCTPTPIKIGLDASYDDDGLPEGAVITHEWNIVSGVTYTPHRFCQDPNVTISAPGDYILQLTVNDGAGHPEGKTGDNSILIRIFSNIDDRLRAHYPLDGNTTDIDEGHPATLVDDPAWGTGQVVGAVELDGTDDLLSDGLNDFVEIDDTGADPNFQAETWENELVDGFTVSAWMKLDADGWSTDWEAIVGKNNQAWELQRNAGNDNVRFVIQKGVGDATSSGATDVETGWHQIVGVYDRNNVKVYVDGIPAGSGNAAPLDLEANPQNTQDWQVPKAAGKVRIGAVSNVTADGDPQDLAFAGLIDQVRIFDAAVPWWAQHSNTPGIVEMYRADGGHDSCGGEYVPGDENQDCLITLADFALVAKNWLQCNNIADENCD